MSGSRQPEARLRRVVAAAGATLAAAAILAPAASAQNFTLNECAGEGILGRGASFQSNAHTYWGGSNVFKRPTAGGGCGSAGPNILWDATGSGAGRASLGERAATNPSGDRDPSVRFAGTDEPPTPTQVDQMQKGAIDANGLDATAADNGKLHVIPVAIGAMTAIVNLPGTLGQCTVGTDVIDLATPAEHDPPDDPQRAPREGVGRRHHHVGRADPDDDRHLPAATASTRRSSASCAWTPRARRSRFKQLPGRDRPGRAVAGLGNTAWPKNTGATAVVRGGRPTAAAPLRTMANSTDGAIGYLVLADAAQRWQLHAHAGRDTTTTRSGCRSSASTTATYDDPQADADGFKSTAHGARRQLRHRRARRQRAGQHDVGDWAAPRPSTTRSATASAR